MNIYSLLMASNKGDTFFPKLPAKDIIRGTSSYASKKHSTEKITKRSIDKDNRNLRTTYYDIVQIPHFPGTLGMGSVAYSKTETIKQQQEMKTTQTCIKKCQSPELFKINGYEVIKEIGKGGFAEVFQCINEQGQKFAIKQYVLTNSPECYKNECIVGEHFFERGKLRSKFAQKRGGSNLIGFQEKIKNGKKGYIVQEIGGKSLSKTISDIQGVFHKGERVYEVKFSKFYEELVFQKKLKSLMIQIAEGIKLLNFEGYIHCDLKPENILVNQTENGNYIFKIIDFGSAFRLEEGLPKITITPQYMPPELLEELSSSGMYQQPSRNSDSFSSSVNKGMSRLNKIDIWSLGCVLLQILTGVPLWFRYKCKISLSRSGKEYLQLGFFALTNRQYHKIVKKQKEICLNLKKINFVYNELEIYRGILNRMLVFDPSQRASIDEILSLLQKLP